MIAEALGRPGFRARNRHAIVRSGALGRRGQYRLLRIGLVGIDVVSLAVAVSATGALRLVVDGFLPVVALGFPERHVVASVLVIPVLVALFSVEGLYDPDAILAGSREYARVAHAVSYGVLIVLAASYLIGDGPLVSRSWLLFLWLTSIVCAGLGRFMARRGVRWLRRRGVLRTRVAVVGASSSGIAIAQQLQTATHEGFDVVGFLDEFIPIGQSLLGDLAVVGRPGDLLRGGRLQLADEYVLVPQALPHERLEEITRLMVSRNGPTLRMAVSPSDLLTHGVLIAERASVPLVTVSRARITGIDAALKRGLDLVGASLALLVLSPLALLAMLRGLQRSGRGALVRQHVRGACGEVISFWLFSREVSGWPPLRGIPALLAVMAGKLSLVGPRPAAASHDAATPEEPRLTAVKPGLTGPWRLSGPDASLADQAVHDLAYVRDYTIWEDLRIIWQSLKHLVSTDHGPSLLARWQHADLESPAQPNGLAPGGLGHSTASQSMANPFALGAGYRQHPTEQGPTE